MTDQQQSVLIFLICKCHWVLTENTNFSILKIRDFLIICLIVQYWVVGPVEVYYLGKAEMILKLGLTYLCENSALSYALRKLEIYQFEV